MVLPITKTTLSARLLPSYKALRTLYKADDLSFFSPMVTHSLVNKIATMEKGDALDLYLSQKARGNYKRLMALGRILCIHSNGNTPYQFTLKCRILITHDTTEGRPIAQKLFDQALAAKDMDSEFTFADFLSKGVLMCLHNVCLLKFIKAEKASSRENWKRNDRSCILTLSPRDIIPKPCTLKPSRPLKKSNKNQTTNLRLNC